LEILVVSAFVEGLGGWLGRRSHNKEIDTADQEKSATRSGGSGGQEPVVVWKAANLLEAQVVKGRLVSEGIPATVKGESLGQIYGLTAGKLASTDVLVPALLAEKAQQILETEVDWSLDEEFFSEGEEGSTQDGSERDDPKS
jgi:hypothetical protein